MKKNYTYSLALFISGILFCSFSSNAQISFENANTRLTKVNVHSGCAITVSDMNGDGLDDIARLDDGHDLYIEYQKTGTTFQSVHIIDLGGGSQWGMCVADVDHNGYKDILAGGNNSQQIQLVKMDSSGIMGSIINISTASISGFFMQNANFMDVNNDGWEDIFVCNDNGPSLIWTNDSAGNFAMSSIINFAVHPWILTTGGHGNDPADAGNYGSVWTDFDNDGDIDLYIARCRQGVSSVSDPRRIDQLFVNDGNDVYTQMDTAYGVADSMETWTVSFGDIDNDGDLDLLLAEQDSPSRILENDGSGHYSEITPTTGFSLSIQPVESVMEDFDNDGFIDILVTGASSQLFRNNGNKTFTEITSDFDNEDMESFAIGDLNHDGRIDVYGGYANIYTNPTSVDDVVWMNNTKNTNNFISFHLIGTTSNKSALGARAEIFGAWGKQIREVRSGESYGTCNTSDLHFGLGSSTVIDSVIIRWPSGSKTEIYNPVINQFITIKEDSCISPDNIVTSNGPLVICTGQSVTLNATSGHTYLWSTGATTQSIIVSTAGEYGVSISDAGNSCTSTSAVLNLEVNPDETPTINSSATDLNICQGSTITLLSTPASSYQWSNGATSQSIVVGQSGNYSVTIQGACQSWTSAAKSVTVYPAPAPVANDVTIPAPGIATLNATGNSITWYNTLTGGTPLSTGSSFSTPFLLNDTIFYAADSYSYGGGTSHTGMFFQSGSNLYSGGTTNAIEIFDVLHPCVLKSVKVYTDTPGDRLIELRDFNDNVLQSILVNIPMDTSVVTLNFNLAPGNSYHLGTNSAQNNTLLGTNSPRLQRSNTGVTYPYTIANYVSVTNSDQGSGYYYYFYDWEIIKPPLVCLSMRIPVNVHVTSVGIDNVSLDGNIKVYPNPTNDFINLTFGMNLNSPTKIKILDLTGRTLDVESYETLSAGQTAKINLSNLATGSYFLSIETENGTYTQSMTKVQ